MNQLRYMGKYQWSDTVEFQGRPATIVGHLEKGVYMIRTSNNNIITALEDDLKLIKSNRER